MLDKALSEQSQGNLVILRRKRRSLGRQRSNRAPRYLIPRRMPLAYNTYSTGPTVKGMVPTTWSPTRRETDHLPTGIVSAVWE